MVLCRMGTDEKSDSPNSCVSQDSGLQGNTRRSGEELCSDSEPERCHVRLPSSTLDTSSFPPGAQRYRSVVISGLTLDPAYWHHIALTVFAEDFAFYVNGTVVAVRALEGRMVDVRRSVFLGQTIDCKFIFLSFISAMLHQ